jgi:hypothetical protein
MHLEGALFRGCLTGRNSRSSLEREISRKKAHRFTQGNVSHRVSLDIMKGKALLSVPSAPRTWTKGSLGRQKGLHWSRSLGQKAQLVQILRAEGVPSPIPNIRTVRSKIKIAWTKGPCASLITSGHQGRKEHPPIRWYSIMASQQFLASSRSQPIRQ